MLLFLLLASSLLLPNLTTTKQRGSSVSKTSTTNGTLIVLVTTQMFLIWYWRSFITRSRIKPQIQLSLLLPSSESGRIVCLLQVKFDSQSPSRHWSRGASLSKVESPSKLSASHQKSDYRDRQFSYHVYEVSPQRYRFPQVSPQRFRVSPRSIRSLSVNTMVHT